MTARREVPLTGDTLAWVHTELSEIKSRLALVQQAAEQSRAVATDAADTAHQLRAQIDTFDGHDIAISHLQDDMRAMRELLMRAQEDVNSLRQSREEAERRIQAQSEVARQDKNDAGRRFGEIERQLEMTQERFSPLEEYSRRNLEAIAQLAMRIEGAEAGRGEIVTMQSRAQTALSHIEQEIQRLTGAHAGLQREDDVRQSVTRPRSAQAPRSRTLRQEATSAGWMTAWNWCSGTHARHRTPNRGLGRCSKSIAASSTDDIPPIDTSPLRPATRLRAEDREEIGLPARLSDLASDLRKRQIVALEKEIATYGPRPRVQR
jgi:hypothetical protein